MTTNWDVSYALMMTWSSRPLINRHDVRDLWRALAKAYDARGDTAAARRARWAAAEVATAQCRMARSTVRRQARLF